MNQRTTGISNEQIAAPVVVLTHYLPPYMASVLKHVRRNVPNLSVLLSIDQEPNRQFGNTWSGLDVKVQKSLMLRRPWKHKAGFKEELYVHFPYDTFSQLRRADPSIVFSYELGFRSLVSAAYCRLYRRKLALCVCVSEHTEQGRGAARSMLRRWLIRQADAITFNGPSCRRYLTRFPGSEGKLFHFPYATSDECVYTGPVARADEPNTKLLCIGQLTHRKGVMELLESLCEYCSQRSEKSLEITLVGSGPLQQSLAELSLPPNLSLRLTGHLDYEAMNEEMGRAGVLVFPTKADEWGLVVNEAMQAGLPVLGSIYAQAATTLIREGENGWLYDPHERKQLFAKLDQINSLTAPALLAVRSAAKETVSTITSATSAEKAVAMFRCMLAG
ncbi:MAG: hypothetical protein Aurels2KO_07620 [Aureliella sp.]